MTGAALNSLLKEYGGTLSKFCYSLCKNEHDADDLFQDTCIRLLNSRFEQSSGEETLSFLYRVCLNAYRDSYRAMKRRGRSEIRGLSNEYINNIPDKTADREVYEDLYIAINTLPYKLKIVITLCYFDKHSEKYVADILKIPVGTVKSRLYKARKLLKKELQNNEDHRR